MTAALAYLAVPLFAYWMAWTGFKRQGRDLTQHLADSMGSGWQGWLLFWMLLWPVTFSYSLWKTRGK